MVIQQGVTLEFTKEASLIADGNVRIYSDLSRLPVTFKSHERVSQANSWSGIFLNNQSSVYYWRNVIVESAKIGIQVSSKVNLTLLDSAFKNNETGLHFDGGAKGKAERNYFFANTKYSIRIGESGFINDNTLGTSPTIRSNEINGNNLPNNTGIHVCLLYTSPSPRDLSTSRMPSSA